MTDIPKKTYIVDDQSMLSRYQRAEALEHEAQVESMVLNARIFPNWVNNGRCFWYIRKNRRSEISTTKITKEYRLVDVQSGTNTPAFDHQLLAQKLSSSSGREVDPSDLPIFQLELELTPMRAAFVAFNKHWHFDAEKKSCEEISVSPSNWLVSPNGKKAAFLREYNLWIRELDSGKEYALTEDGKHHYAYGTQPERVNLVAGLGGSSWLNTAIPEALWSPDSTQLLTVQVDERQVLSLPVIEYVPSDGSVRPKTIHTKYALPGDDYIVSYRILAINVASKQVCSANYPPVLDAVLWASLFSGNRIWWSKDSGSAYFVDMARGQQHVKMVAFNTYTGNCRVLFQESSETHIDLNLHYEQPASLLPLLDTNELIWFSERSGWAHLYLYDLHNGQLKNVITSGDWLVREILYFDEQRREVTIQAAGCVAERNPYYRGIYRVNIDTGIMTSIVSSEHDYVVHKPTSISVVFGSFYGVATGSCSGVSPDGHYIVVTRTRADQIPVTELIDRDGNTILEVETADVAGLPKGWQWPEPVKLLAADGKTDIFGLVFRPSDFSADKHYPVLDWANTNSFYGFVPQGAFGNDTMGGYAYMSAAAMAELGFITVLIDGRGTCYRSKAFHDEAYGKMHMGSNLEDHVVGIRQLAERYKYMDLGNIGITDFGGSNGPVYGLLAYPDFYKVGTVQSTWDIRLLTQSESYQGLLQSSRDYEQSVLGNMAGSLTGKLLLMHGALDPYFHISGVLQLVDALVRKNKDFDLVLLPNGGHDVSGTQQYGLRRMWDYLVVHLQGNKPPTNFRLSCGGEFALEKLKLDSR